VYTYYLKEDKSHLDNTVCEEENGQYGCMYVKQNRHIVCMLIY
jgi:hypothetical protein